MVNQQEILRPQGENCVCLTNEQAQFILNEVRQTRELTEHTAEQNDWQFWFWAGTLTLGITTYLISIINEEE